VSQSSHNGKCRGAKCTISFYSMTSIGTALISANAVLMLSEGIFRLRTSKLYCFTMVNNNSLV
jgi:hypothetical protein